MGSVMCLQMRIQCMMECGTADAGYAKVGHAKVRERKGAEKCKRGIGGKYVMQCVCRAKANVTKRGERGKGKVEGVRMWS